MASLANPTVQRGTVTVKTDTTLEKRDISEVIELLDPFDVPLLNMVGQNSLHFPCTQVKHEWIEDRLIPRAGTLSSAYVAGSGQITVTSGEGKFLLIDDTILIDDMIFRVVSGPPDSDTLTVTLIRGTDAAAAAATAWRKLGHAAPEGGVSRLENRKTVANIPYNYTQIMKDWAVVTGTMDVISRYGYNNERAYNEEKILKNLTMDLEQLLLYGVRTVDDGPPRRSTMGGLFEYVYLAGIADSWPTILNAADGDFTETMMNNMMQVGADLGSHWDFIMVNGTNKRRITSWATPRIRTERDERMAGASVGSYESDFGIVDVIFNRNLRASDIIFGTKGSLGIGPLNGRQFSSRLVPKLGDFDHWEILGEYTMEVHRAKVDFAWIYNTSTTY
jgi:hypothetical protein